MTGLMSRRVALKSSAFGLLAVALPNVIYAKSMAESSHDAVQSGKHYYRYPAIADDVVSEVVGASHFNFERVKELVDRRPELARACWDWRFGDWESAIGAASHMGRRDIALYLIEHGARPNIFTFAMLGEVDVVRSMVKAAPGIQTTSGPHGITLLDHARIGARSEDLSSDQSSRVRLTIDYLQSIDGADQQPLSIEMTQEEQVKYLGEYRFGEGEDEVMVVDTNMRELLSMGRKGTFGGTIDKVGDGRFVCRGCPSVEVRFVEKNGMITELSVHEPDMIVKAKKL